MKRSLSYAALVHASFSLAALILLPSILTGCGGGSGSSSLSSTGTTAPAASSASLTIVWPAQPKTASGIKPALIPVAANSIVVTIKSTTNTSAAPITKTVNRPVSGSTTTVTFDLPPDTFTVTATAYPQAGGLGTAQATGTGTLTTKAGQTATLSINMSSTITALTISPTAPSVVVGSTITLAASGLDASGAMVLLSASKLTWSSSNTSVATINSSGIVTGVKIGSATIKVTDSESGKSGTITVAVPFAPYTITDLGTFFPAAINATGQMAGSVTTGSTTHANLYSNGTLTDLGALPGAVGSSATGINVHGQVIGVSLVGEVDFTRAFVYSAGKMIDLGTDQVQYSNPYGINASGQIVGTSGIGHATKPAVLFHVGSTTPTILLSLPNNPYGLAYAINDSGETIGDSESADGDNYQAVIFHLDGSPATPLGFLPGDDYSNAFGINASGQVVGFSLSTHSGSSHAFLYTGGKMTALPDPAGGFDTSGTGINDSGQIIGISHATTSGIQFPFTDNSGTSLALKSLLSTSDQAKWTLQSVTGINNSGQICGTGFMGGQTHGYLLTPKP